MDMIKVHMIHVTTGSALRSTKASTHRHTQTNKHKQTPTQTHFFVEITAVPWVLQLYHWYVYILHPPPPHTHVTFVRMDESCPIRFNHVIHKNESRTTVSMRIYIHIFVQIYIRMYTYTYICIHICTSIYTYICVYMYIYIYIYIFIYTHIYMHIHIYIYIQINIYLTLLYGRTEQLTADRNSIVSREL